MKIVVFSSLCCLAFACENSSDPITTPDAGDDCSLDPQAQTYAPGMIAAAPDGVQVVLLEATPAPPARFENYWVVQVLGADDQPIDGVSVKTRPFMPEHGHGAKAPELEPGDAANTLKMGPFDLWMPGIWEMNFDISVGDVDSVATFRFCIPE